MPFDREGALVLAAAAARAFTKDLENLVEAADAEVAAAREKLAQEEEAQQIRHRAQELDITDRRTRLEEHAEILASDRAEMGDLKAVLEGEAAMLSEARQKLQRDREQLNEDREQFEQERSIWGVDMVKFNVGGTTTISTLKSTVTQCEDSMLAAALSGRWSIAKDADGSIFVDFPPKLFVPLIEYMQLRSIEDPENPTPPPSFEDDDLEVQFEGMLRYYSLLEWVYRPEPVSHHISIGKHCYAVLPEQDPNEESVGRDMQDQTFNVPPGWEVLSAGSDEFSTVIVELTAHHWGAHMLCVENGRGGFDSYRTAARMALGGPAGSIFEADIEWLEKGESSRSFRFRGLSGRLVIRARAEALRSAVADDTLTGPLY